MTTDLLYEVQEGIAFVTFNRPQTRNALTFAMYERLAEISALADKDRSIKAMVITGAGEEAFAAGLVSELVEDQPTLMKRAEELARQVASHAPLTLQATKEALLRLRPPVPRDAGNDLVLMCYMSEDFREGMDAFLEKRKPV